MYVAWKCYPESKGLVTSVIFAANGLGSIIAAILSTMLVNPDGLNPSIIVHTGTTNYKYFDREVTSNVPFFLRVFAYAEIIILVFALYYIYIPDKSSNNEDDDIRMPWKVESSLSAKLKATLVSKQFICSYIMMFLSVLYF